VSSTNPTVFEIARLQAASEWVQRLNASTDPVLTDQWMEWCSSDPLNLRAFEQMQSVWDGFSGAQDSSLSPHRPSARFTRRSRLIGLAASILLILGGTGWFALRYARNRAFDTAVGQQQREILSDGSHLDLAPDSRVSVRFTLTRRDVRLERGQAYFAVAHSAMRPFIVHADGLTVTAMGTAFDVRTGESGAVVTVSEGRVNVASDAEPQGGAANAAAETIHAGIGQRVTFSRPAHRLSVAAVDPEAAESWRDGILQFVGDPLEEVADEVNLYSARNITVASGLRRTLFTGTVSAANVDDWLKALEQIFSVEIVDQGINGTHIRSRDDHGNHE
jgi:transmembrane sensor